MSNKEKMSPQDFVDKVESEGLEYAFLHYGLSADDLDPNDDLRLYHAVLMLDKAFADLKPLLEVYRDAAAKYE